MSDPTRRPGRPRLRPNPDGAHDPTEEILRVAAGQFTERGYDSTTIASIAAEVGLQRASIYHHYRNKDAMLADIGRRHLAPLVRLLDRFAVEDHPAELQLLRYLRIDIRHMLGSPFDLGRLFHLPATADKARFPDLWQTIDHVHNGWATWIADATATGALLPLPETTASMLEACYLGVLSTPREALSADPAATADLFADAALRAMLTDPQQLDDLRERALRLDGPDPSAAED